MRLFKNRLKARIASLESYLGVVHYIDEYNDSEHISNDYGTIKRLTEKIEKLEKKVFPKNKDNC